MSKIIYVKLIGFGLGLALLISLFSALGVIFQATPNTMILIQICAFLLAAGFFTFYMKKKERSLVPFGFKQTRINQVFYLAIGSTVLIQPAILGLNLSLPLSTLVLIFIQMALVGYTEEVLFRGIFFYSLRDKQPQTVILFSSIIFGMLHLASGLNPNQTLFLVVLQLINALLLGMVFAVFYYLTENIYLVISFHALFNILASVSQVGSLEKDLLAVSTLAVLYLIILTSCYYLHAHKK